MTAPTTGPLKIV